MLLENNRKPIDSDIIYYISLNFNRPKHNFHK